jgi:Ca-activated chloride channel family protein
MTEPALPIIECPPNERPGEIGRLSVRRSDEEIALPLAAHGIRATAVAGVAEVVVEQVFRNPYQEFLEAVYVFPLSGGAAVSAFELKIGGRTLKAIVKERGEARLDYAKALEEGKRTALLEQERDNVFTVQVGNLPPGEDVSVRIVYSDRLSTFEDGVTELRFPLVVAPRYIPGEPIDGVPAGAGVEPDTDAVPDASRITPPRLAPGVHPGVALSIEVELADGAVSDLACSQHAVKLSNGRVALSRTDELLNRDFVLRWRLAKGGIQSRLLVNRAGCAMLSLVAPAPEQRLETSRNVVFLLDRSGSMQGVKMASAARACSILLATLGPRDHFAVCAFSSSTQWMDWTQADESGIAEGGKFLRNVHADGGTELLPALDETLQRIRKRKTSGADAVVVLITDGQIGNEAQLFKRVQKDGVRIFTIGIDTAVNDAFLRRLASKSGGTCTFCVPGEALDQALAVVAREIGAPLVTDLRFDGADQIAPSRTPDLFAGRASTSFFVGNKIDSVQVHGKYSDGRPFSVRVKAEPIDLPALAHLWARARVTDLEDRFRLGEDLKQEIVNLSVKHTVLTRFTAFVVVDENGVVNQTGSHRTLVQPVEMPHSWQAYQSPAGVLSATRRASSANLDASALSIQSIGGKLLGQLYGRAKSIAQKRMGSPSPIASAITDLSTALITAQSMLDYGATPSHEAIDKARQALLDALDASPVSAQFDKLREFLNGLMVELVAALRSKNAASVRPILVRALKQLESLTKRRNFWEAGV